MDNQMMLMTLYDYCDVIAKCSSSSKSIRACESHANEVRSPCKNITSYGYLEHKVRPSPSFALPAFF